MTDLSHVKSMLRAVLMSCKAGVPVRKLAGDYQAITGDRIPYLKLGHDTLEDFLHSIPDAVRVGWSKDGEATAFAVADDKTQHLSKLIANQKSKPSRSKKPNFKYRKPFAPTQQRSSYTSRQTFQHSRFGHGSSFLRGPSDQSPKSRPRFYAASNRFASQRSPPLHRQGFRATPPPNNYNQRAVPGHLSSIQIEVSKHIKSRNVTHVVQNAVDDRKNDQQINKFPKNYAIPPRFRNKGNDSNSYSSKAPNASHVVNVAPPSSSGSIKEIERDKIVQTANKQNDNKSPGVPSSVNLALDPKSLLNQYAQRRGGGQLYFNTFSPYTSKTGGFISSVKVEGQLFGSKDIYLTKKLAEAEAAKGACQTLNITPENLNKVKPIRTRKKVSSKGRSPSFMDMCINNDDLDLDDEIDCYKIVQAPKPCSVDIETVKHRVRDLVATKPNGLWSTRLSVSYKEEYNETLPSNVDSLLDEWTDIVRVEDPTGTNMRILYPVEQANIIMTDEHLVFASDDMTIEPPRVPRVGESVKVFLTYFENCHEFYVQETNSVATKILENLQEIYQSRGSPKCLKSLHNGLCCVSQFSEDSSWYRGVITSTRTSAKFEPEAEIFYLDFGNTEYRPKEKVKRILEHLLKPPAQAIKCSLFGVLPKGGTWTPDCADAFNLLVGGGDDELDMEVVSISDGTCEVYLHNKKCLLNDYLVQKGFVKVKVIEPESLVIPDTQYLNLFISYISRTTEIVVRLIGEAYSNKLGELESDMCEHYRTHPVYDLEKPSVGTVYAARWDDNIIRVKVISIENNQAEVYFLDHGDTTSLPISDTFPIKPSFNTLPYQAITCSLSGLEDFDTNETVVLKLNEMMLAKSCFGEVKGQSDRLSIVLYDTSGAEDVNINDYLISLVEDEELRPLLPKEGGSIEVFVSHVADNGLIYVQLPGHAGIKRFGQLLDDINNHYDKPSRAQDFVSNPEPGQLVCSRYIGEWYRAEILQLLPDGMVEVFYVDYGNLEVVDVKTLRVANETISSHLKTLPHQAIECILYGLPPVGGTWTQTAIAKVVDLIQTNQPLPIKVACSATDDSPVQLSFFTFSEAEQDYISVVQTLLDEPEIFNDDSSDSDVESTAGAGDVCLDSVAKALSNIELDSRRNYSTSPTSRQNYPTSPTSDNPSENHKTNSIQPISSDLDSRRNYSTSPTSQTSADLNDSSENHKTNSIQPISSDLDLNTNTNPQRKTSCEMAIPDGIDIAAVNEFMDVHVMWTCHPGNFTCVLYENVEHIEKMMQDMHEFYSKDDCIYTEAPTTIEQRHQLYAAACEGKWYRIMVKSVVHDQNQVSALLVDFGHYDCVKFEDIRPLHMQFYPLPLQAFRAGLAGVEPHENGWTQAAEERFSQLVLHKDLCALVIGKADNKLLVKLVDTSNEDVDISIEDVLVEEGLVRLSS